LAQTQRKLTKSATRSLAIFYQISGAGEGSHSEPKQQISGVNGGFELMRWMPPLNGIECAKVV